MFVKNVLARHCLGSFQGTFRLANNMHHHSIKHAANNFVMLKRSLTQFYGTRSLEYQAAYSWNILQNQVYTDLLQELSHKSKDTLTKHFLNNDQY